MADRVRTHYPPESMNLGHFNRRHPNIPSISVSSAKFGSLFTELSGLCSFAGYVIGFSVVSKSPAGLMFLVLFLKEQCL
jgi:hypothetical protein